MFALFACPAAALPDNMLSPAEVRDGWILLFDGESMDNWMTETGRPSQRPVEDGAINPHGSGGSVLVHKQIWDNFVLSMDMKISKGCNSGIFLRIFPLTPNSREQAYFFNGLEIAVDDTKGTGYHDMGAIYDLVKPRKNAGKPAGEWNHWVITCDRNIVLVELNGELVSKMDLNDFSEPGKRPDGTDHKFGGIAWKDKYRYGYIGLQEHGADCWYKNIKLKPLW